MGTVTWTRDDLTSNMSADFYESWDNSNWSYKSSYVDYRYYAIHGQRKSITSYRGPKILVQSNGAPMLHPVEITTVTAATATRYICNCYLVNGVWFLPKYYRTIGDPLNHADLDLNADSSALLNEMPGSFVVDTALAKAYADASEPDLSVGQSLVELRETVDMLRKPLSSLRKFMSKPRNRKRIRDMGDAAIGTWLEARYGWRPLVCDVSNILSYLRGDFDTVKMKIQSSRGSQKLVYTKEFETPISVPQGLGVAQCKASVFDKANSKIFFRFNEPLSWQQALGVDWNSVPELAWEKVPLSFVVDWWFNVGLWLSAHKSVPQREILGSYTSVKRTVRIEAEAKRAWGYNGELYTFPERGKSVVEKRKLVRIVNPSLPALPSVNDAFKSVMHAIDGACLSLQRMNFGGVRKH